MTVVDARGFASQCKAIVHVVGGAAPTTNATIVDGSAQDQTQSTTAVATDTTSSSTSTVSDTTTQVSDTATKVSSNVSDKVTSILSTGEGVWSKMRQMSLVAIGLFFIVFIIIFVMRKMFGGGDEGGHH
jgi:cobalamin biosynthesis Mg chelatase CobN